MNLLMGMRFYTSMVHRYSAMAKAKPLSLSGEERSQPKTITMIFVFITVNPHAPLPRHHI